MTFSFIDNNNYDDDDAIALKMHQKLILRAPFILPFYLFVAKQDKQNIFSMLW